MMVVNDVTAKTLMPIVKANVAKEATIMTDEHNACTKVADHFAGHGTTTHSAGQYVDYEDRTIHSNTVEGYFSIFVDARAEEVERLPWKVCGQIAL